MNGGSVPAAQPGRDFLGGRSRVAVLLGVGPVAVAVLEVDAEVLDRLAPQLVDDPRAHGLGKARPRPARRPSAAAKRARVGRVLVERRQREGAELRGGVGLEQMRAAVDACAQAADRRSRPDTRGPPRGWSCEGRQESVRGHADAETERRIERVVWVAWAARS